MALSDYSDMEKEIINAPEPKILAAGSEVKARIISVRSGESEKNNARWYTPVFDVPSDPMVSEFNTFFWDPLEKEKLDAKQFERNKFQFSQFVKALGIDLSRPFSWEDDLPGKEGWVILSIRKSEEYGDQNQIKKFVIKR